jgi:hypothetical protein
VRIAQSYNRRALRQEGAILSVKSSVTDKRKDSPNKPAQPRLFDVRAFNRFKLRYERGPALQASNDRGERCHHGALVVNPAEIYQKNDIRLRKVNCLLHSADFSEGPAFH